MKNDLYVIEKRNPDGSLNLSKPQPESVFGLPAIQGITEDAMAKIVFRVLKSEKTQLRGDGIANWPTLIDPLWVARRKTW